VRANLIFAFSRYCDLRNLNDNSSGVICAQILLPKGCCRIDYYSDVYVPSYKCNLLGIPPSVDVPLGTALCILVDVTDLPVNEEDDAVRKSLPSGVRVVPDRTTPEELERVRSSFIVSESDSGPHSLIFVDENSAREMGDLSAVCYRVLHAPDRLPSKGISMRFCSRLVFNLLKC
jgi:Folliculin C-terminal domain